MDKLRRSLYRKKKNVIKDAYCFLDINDIVANKEQPRTHFEDEKIQELAESIMQNGLLQPIVVREYEGKYQIVVGERRYRACKLAGITEVPCIIQSDCQCRISRKYSKRKSFSNRRSLSLPADSRYTGFNTSPAR